MLTGTIIIDISALTTIILPSVYHVNYKRLNSVGKSMWNVFYYTHYLTFVSLISFCLKDSAHYNVTYHDRSRTGTVK